METSIKDHMLLLFCTGLRAWKTFSSQHAEHSCHLALFRPLNAFLYVNSSENIERLLPNFNRIVTRCWSPDALAYALAAHVLHPIQRRLQATPALPRYVLMCTHLCLPHTIAIVMAKPCNTAKVCVCYPRYYTIIKYSFKSLLRKASCCAALFNCTSGCF